MYSRCRNIVIGFHGCDKAVRDGIIAGKIEMEKSINNYDWLGHGFYFWENNLERALSFAQEQQRRYPAKISEPAVLGAFIDLEYCLDLLDSTYLSYLPKAYQILCETNELSGKPLPTNDTIPNASSNDLLIRNLDCAVIETLHTFNKDKNITPFDSVRGVFWEGKEVYPGAGFREKNHIQICLRNPNCIKGFFLPREKI